MAKPAAKIHLEKSEFWILCGIVFLFAGLTFSLGVMVGAGLDSASHVAANGHDEVEVHSSGHHSEEKGSPNHKVSRKVASHSAPSKIDAQDQKEMPGSSLRQAYRKAKQLDFEEMLSVDSSLDTGPVSVQDSQAYFESREKTKEQERELPLETNMSGLMESRDPASEAMVRQEPPQQVTTLFERRPASANDYSPVFGEYTVLVASYSTEDEARSKLAGLRAAGFNEAYFKPEKSKDDGAEWFRVSVGSYKDISWALKTKETLKKKSLASTPIVRKVD